jgi:hypothetical protein
MEWDTNYNLKKVIDELSAISRENMEYLLKLVNTKSL